MEGPIASLLWRSLRVHQIFGANTEVGKTIFTTLLCRTAQDRWRDERVFYLKPVSTGALDEADDTCAKTWPSQVHIRRFAPAVAPKTLFQYDIPVSPHLAAKVSKQVIPSDQTLLTRCRQVAEEWSGQGKGWLFLETAGGVHSPGPSGSTQADLYAPLRIPVILIGDSRLGGISQTISAFESLHVRGYNVKYVLLFQDTKYGNSQYLSEYFADRHGISVESIPTPPERDENRVQDAKLLDDYYGDQNCQSTAQSVLEQLEIAHEERISRLEQLPQQAHRHIWYPFTQQKLVQEKDITVIDSAYGDYFQTVAPSTNPSTPLLRSSFDGSASWWTQGLGHSNPRLTLAAAHAAGRFGHVMFASAVHEPAMSLAESLLKGMKNPRLNRVFFSDNGSTGTEVAVKMGLRAARVRYGWGTEQQIGVLGLKGGYHGDTIGAMDMAEPCAYNEKIEWYEGKGFWFDYPTVLCSDGQWAVKVDPDLRPILGQGKPYSSLSDIFNVEEREERNEHIRYEEYITETLTTLQQQGRRFGSLIIEPVVLGAGGMNLVDPLFQRTLVNVIRRSPHLFSTENSDKGIPQDGNDWSGLPVIFDEVFTGLYRLGRFSSSSFLNVYPDISVHAKLLTGGLIPLSTTLASEQIFEVFGSDDKTDALLHGHSYTAHPIGCQVALESLKQMQSMEQREFWSWAQKRGWTAAKGEEGGSPRSNVDSVWSMWSQDFVKELSRNTERVVGIWALGNVLAIHLRDAAGSSYTSNVAQVLRESLAEGKDSGTGGPWNVHSRVLGNVLYVMTSQVTTETSVGDIENLLRKSLL